MPNSFHDFARITGQLPTLTTVGSSNVGTSSGDVEGSLDDLKDASEVDCFFQYREQGTSTFSETSKQTLTSTQNYTDTISGLNSSTTYEFRAVGTAPDGDTGVGLIQTFTTS